MILIELMNTNWFEAMIINSLLNHNFEMSQFDLGLIESKRLTTSFSERIRSGLITGLQLIKGSLFVSPFFPPTNRVWSLDRNGFCSNITGQIIRVIVAFWRGLVQNDRLQRFRIHNFICLPQIYHQKLAKHFIIQAIHDISNVAFCQIQKSNLTTS